ncbi:hypothetical protein [Oxalobacter paraformigenes]|uniref:hypothetical protein n=1 Tax=Oxalobacter paraformigenes TaxID=556268 RepID=UPI001C9C3243|nr:hypothetical protein [Oxalobacter paraformigenes]
MVPIIDGFARTANKEVIVLPVMPSKASVIVSFFQYSARVIVDSLTVVAMEKDSPDR